MHLLTNYIFRNKSSYLSNIILQLNMTLIFYFFLNFNFVVYPLKVTTFCLTLRDDIAWVMHFKDHTCDNSNVPF